MAPSRVYTSAKAQQLAYMYAHVYFYFYSLAFFSFSDQPHSDLCAAVTREVPHFGINSFILSDPIFNSLIISLNVPFRQNPWIIFGENVEKHTILQREGSEKKIMGQSPDLDSH